MIGLRVVRSTCTISEVRTRYGAKNTRYCIYIAVNPRITSSKSTVGEEDVSDNGMEASGSCRIRKDSKEVGISVIYVLVHRESSMTGLDNLNTDLVFEIVVRAFTR